MMVETKEETGDRWPDEEDETLKAYRTPKETPIAYVHTVIADASGVLESGVGDVDVDSKLQGLLGRQRKRAE